MVSFTLNASYKRFSTEFPNETTVDPNLDLNAIENSILFVSWFILQAITRNRKMYNGKIAWDIKWNEFGASEFQKFQFSQKSNF